MINEPSHTVRLFERAESRGETTVFRVRAPKARKSHDCAVCGESIEKGMRYVIFVTRDVEGPGWEIWKLHGECYLSGQPMFEGVRPDWRWDGETE